MQATSNKTLVVLCAQSGPLITRRLDQLPVAPAVGVVFNFDSEYYQQVQPSIVCIGRTASGNRRDPNVMLFEVLNMLHSPTEVADILRRRICSYTVPDKEGGRIIQVVEKLEDGCDDIVFLQCKRMHIPQPGQPSISQMLVGGAEGSGGGKAAGTGEEHE